MPASIAPCMPTSPPKQHRPPCGVSRSCHTLSSQLPYQIPHNALDSYMVWQGRPSCMTCRVRCRTGQSGVFALNDIVHFGRGVHGVCSFVCVAFMLGSNAACMPTSPSNHPPLAASPALQTPIYCAIHRDTVPQWGSI